MQIKVKKCRKKAFFLHMSKKSSTFVPKLRECVRTGT